LQEKEDNFMSIVSSLTTDTTGTLISSPQDSAKIHKPYQRIAHTGKTVNQKMHVSIQHRFTKLAERLNADRDVPASLSAVSHLIQTPNAILPLVDASLRRQVKTYLRSTSSAKKAGHPVDSVEEKGLKYHTYALPGLLSDIPYPPPKQWDFRFIDLFAGIGGFRIAFQQAGGKSFFSSEWDKFAQQTYVENFGEIPYGDITQINEQEIPDHDVLCAGFPCQPFSLAGVSKKNALGRKHGFEDETQGTLFFDIKRILNEKRPKAFMLENVKNLMSHDKGKTFQVIRRTLEEELGYVVNWKIVDAAAWVPQHRERIFIVGYDPDQVEITKEEIWIPEGPDEGYQYTELHTLIGESVDDHTVGPGTWEALKRHKAHHEKAGNGFGYGLITLPIESGRVTRTISARYHKDGAEILIEQPGNRPRRLTVREAMQLQGYDPERYRFPVSKTQAYRQIGNSVAVPAVAACAQEIARVLRERSRER
jgi:DNA (cytosine-5)-methyltransferase 1